MAYKRKSSNRHHQNTTFMLNITSMTDMFTIMLVFLLQNYSTSVVQVTQDKDINLPNSKVETNPVEALKVSISAKELKLEGRTIASLTMGKFDPTALEDQDPNFIKPLFNELQKWSKDSKKKEDAEGKIFLLADSRLPYELLKKIMYTASMAGYPKLKLATIQGN